MTIYDIAKKCNVSIATVSRVLNNKGEVKESTRRKVLAAIEDQSFHPNAFARGLGLKTIRLVGVLCVDVADSFYARAVSLLENELHGIGFDVVLECSGYEDENKTRYLRFLMEKHVDAVIVIGSPFSHEDDISYLRAAAKRLPLIAINSYFDLSPIYSIRCDEEQGMFDAVVRLAHAGAFSVLYLYDSDTCSGQQKLLGYDRAVAHCNLSTASHLRCQVPRSLDGARSAVEVLLERGLEFDSVVASEDLFAVAALKALTKAGLSLPVIGCNNSILAECASPTVTSIDNRLDLLCSQAVSLLVGLFSDKKPLPSRRQVFSPVLVERESFSSPVISHPSLSPKR